MEESSMDAAESVAELTDAQILATFGTAEAPAARGFDETTQTRVFAYQLVRARHRAAHYRALYVAFVEAGKRYLVENLAEAEAEAAGAGATPAKLVGIDDDAEAQELAGRGDVAVWTEPALLEAVRDERAIVDFFTGLLDEVRPRLAGARR